MNKAWARPTEACDSPDGDRWAFVVRKVLRDPAEKSCSAAQLIVSTISS